MKCKPSYDMKIFHFQGPIQKSILFMGLLVLSMGAVRGQKKMSPQKMSPQNKAMQRKEPQKTWDITSFGAKGDGQTNNSSSIQHAIDTASGQGGGVVLVPAGRFLTGVITLRSGVELRLAEEAVLLGSARRGDYGGIKASALIVAEGQHQLSITGKGIIDGQGRELAKDVIRMLQDGSLQDPEWQVVNPWHQKRPAESNRPGLIRFSHCNDVTLSGITLRDAACWVQTYVACSGLTLDHIRVESTAYWNNDGIDVVDCRDVKISNCEINAGDDGICIKSSDPHSRCENVRIEDCRVRSSASALKLGTASYGGFKHIIVRNLLVYDTYRSAIALESVDGGILEDVDIQHVLARNTGNAIFIRLGHRSKTAPIGIVRHVSIRDVTVEVPAGKPDKGYEMEGPEPDYPHNVFPSSITGLPGHPVQDVVLERVEMVYEGGGKKEKAWFGLDSLNKVPEREDSYPEFSMFGELPAWALYVRHATGIRLRDVILRYKKDDFRPAVIFDDVRSVVIQELQIPTAMSKPVVILKNCPSYKLKDNQLPFDNKKTIQIR
jgi:polygalacturonase